MGFREAGWVLDESPYRLARRLVHVVLAEWANEANDYELHYSIPVIAKKAAVSQSTVRETLAVMAADGFLKVLAEHPGRPTSYRFQMPGTPLKSGGVAKTDPPNPACATPLIQESDYLVTKVITKGRATRCPEPFIVNSDMRLWASEHAPLIDVHLETTKFCNYWRAKAGKDATKLDWKLTWRNWLLSAYPAANGNGHQYRPPAAVRVRETESPDAYVHTPAPMPANLRALIPKEETP
jgi:hypothetical protein